MNILRATLDFARVLLDAIRHPEERGGPGARQSMPALNVCMNCGERDGAHVVGCPKGAK